VHATNVLNQRKGSKDEPFPSPLLGTSSLQVPALFVCLQHATNHAGSSRRRIHRPSKPKAVVALQRHRFRCRTRYSTSTSVSVRNSRSTCNNHSIGSAETDPSFWFGIQEAQWQVRSDTKSGIATRLDRTGGGRKTRSEPHWRCSNIASHKLGCHL